MHTHNIISNYVQYSLKDNSFVIFQWLIVMLSKNECIEYKSKKKEWQMEQKVGWLSINSKHNDQMEDGEMR